MPTLCSKCDPSPHLHEVCDFCKHFDFNGNASGAYTGNGFCRLHQCRKEPEGGCSDFYCRKADTEMVPNAKLSAGLGEKWLCPWGICTTEQAKQCRAEEKGCGGRFQNTTAWQAKKEIDVPCACSKCGQMLPPNGIDVEGARTMTDQKTQKLAFARSRSNAGLGDSLEHHKALVIANYIMEGRGIEAAYMEGESEVNKLLIAFMPLPPEPITTPNVELTGSAKTPETNN